MGAFEEGYAFLKNKLVFSMPDMRAASMSIRLTQKLPNSSTI